MKFPVRNKHEIFKDNPNNEAGPVLKFVFQLMVCPAACAFLLLAWLLSRFVSHPKPLDTILNMCGLFLFAFFLTITLTTLRPFQCAPNPNGSSSLVSDPGIICYESEEHMLFISIAAIGFLTQPLPVIVGAAYVTLMYPSRVASGKGLRMVNRYRFLFHRFKSEQYYYGLLLLCRNGLVALLPILVVGAPEVQMPCMGLILLASLVMQARLYPWRTEQANHVEVVLTVLLLLLLIGAAPLLSHDLERSSSVLGWLLCIPVVGLALTCLGALLRAFLGHFKRNCLYGMFLCHHKGGAGSLCRLIKILVARHSKLRVFLDCDQLENLDLLFDIVRSSSESVVVVLTPEVLKRAPWSQAPFQEGVGQLTVCSCLRSVSDSICVKGNSARTVGHQQPRFGAQARSRQHGRMASPQCRCFAMAFGGSRTRRKTCSQAIGPPSSSRCSPTTELRSRPDWGRFS